MPPMWFHTIGLYDHCEDRKIASPEIWDIWARVTPCGFAHKIENKKLILKLVFNCSLHVKFSDIAVYTEIEIN